MENQDKENQVSPDEVQRRLQARGLLTTVLPRSRGQSPARAAVAYGNPDSLPGSAGNSPNPIRRDLTDRHRPDSPIIREGGEVKIPGEDEFNQMFDSVRSRDLANGSSKEYSLVAAFSKVSKVLDPPTLTAESTEYNPTPDPTARQSERADTLSNIDRSRPQHERDFISLFSKPGSQTTQSQEPLHEIDNTAEKRGNDSSRAMGRRRRNRPPGTRTRRQQLENSQRIDEDDNSANNASSGQNKPYLPSYIQPVTKATRQVGAPNEYSAHVPKTNQAQSIATNSLSEVHRRPPRKGFVKRQRARPGDNRLSSSTSGDSSDEAVEKVPKRFNESAGPDRVDDEHGAHPVQRSRIRTRQRQRSKAAQQQVVSHPDYVGGRDRKISQPLMPSSKQSNFPSHLNDRHTNRKQYLTEEVDKYSTLPANFRQSLGPNVAEQPLSTTTDQSKPNGHKQSGKLLDDINQNILPNRHELIISGEQTSVSSEGRAKARNAVHQSNANQSQTKPAPTNVVLQSNKASTRVDVQGAAPGRKGSIDKTAVQLPQNKRTIGDLRNLFDSTDGPPKTEFGQVFNGSSSKKHATPARASSSRKSSVSEQQHEVPEVVYRPRMIEARKVGEDYWPRDEDTEKLLNRNYVNVKNPDDLAHPGRLSGNDFTDMDNSSSMYNGHEDVDTTGVPTVPVHSPKETNLNDGENTYFSETPNNISQSMPTIPGHISTKVDLSIKKQSSIEAPLPTSIKNIESNSDPQQLHGKKLTWNFDEPDAKLKQFNPTDVGDRFIPTSQITEQVLKDITESLHDISIGGKKVYQAPTLDISVVPQVTESNQDDTTSVLDIPSKITSSRKSSVVSQSTALPRKSTSQQPGLPMETGDIDEGCFTEEDTANRPHSIDQDTALLCSVKGLTNGVEAAVRRRRKYSAGTQGTSDSTSISTGAESSRSLSDPMPHGNIPIQEPGDDFLGHIEGKKGHPLDNSVSDLSNYSENILVQDDFDENIHDTELGHTDFKKSQSGKSGAKVVKKKSFSDPITKAVVTAGKMGKVQSPSHDSQVMYTSSSEPNLSEQTDGLGELNGFKKLHDRGSRTEPMKSPVGHIPNQTMTIPPDLKSPRMVDAPPSDSSNRSSLAEKSDGMDHVFEHEEKQFQQVFESMTSPTETSRKMSISHGRSCSEPVDLDNSLIQMSSNRVRRPGIIQAPSMTDVTMNNLGSNMVNAKQFSSSVDGIHSATLPRAAGSRGLDYQDMRKHVVKNLLDTEGSYVKSLRILFETYLTPLKRPENHNICEPRHVDIIFFQIPEILQHHQRFYANVRDCYQNWDPQYVKMGDVFLQSFNKDKLVESYTSYIDNFNNSREAVLYATQAKSGFKVFLEQCQRENKEKQGLSDLLIKPVQRIPRYELILKDLLKHTPDDHQDRQSLLLAQEDIHALSVQMNRGKKEAEAADRHDRQLREIEQLVEGVIEIAGVPKRRFLRQEILAEHKSGSKKDRCLWLFNDLLMCTQVKKGRTGSLRRGSTMNLYSSPSDRILIDYTCKYKFLWKFPLEDVELLKGSTTSSRQCAEKQLQHLRRDHEILVKIDQLALEMSCSHANLDDALRELMYQTNQRIAEKQNVTPAITLPGRMEIGISTSDGMKIFPFEFMSEDRKTQFEILLINARTNSTSQKGRWDPAFLKAIPVSKNRNGMQLSCSSANTDAYSGLKEVWVCNTDDYVGEICFLNVIDGDPCQSHCVRVCKSKICCITQAPAWDRRLVPTSTFLSDVSKAPLVHDPDRRRSSSNSNLVQQIIAWDDTDESDEDNTSPFSTRSYCSSGRSPYSTNNSMSNYDISTSTDTTIMSEPGGNSRTQNPLMHNLTGSSAFKKDSDGSTLHGSLEDLLLSDGNSTVTGASGNLSAASKALAGLGSMWMGTEDGTINVYSSSESHGDPKSIAQLHHSAPLQCMLYHEGQMFVALSNGDLVIYFRNMTTGHWNFEKPKTVSLGVPSSQITKMIVVGEKDLWCGCQNQVMIIDMKTHNLKSFFAVSQDSKRQIYCMVCCGYGVWVALDRRAQIKLYHTVTHELITDIDVTQPVGKMLASSDAIIRQHKAACLRITSLLVCKDLLWVGTSAGVVLTMALPSITASTHSLPLPIIPQGLTYGHTGHARFLMSIEIPEKEATPVRGYRRPSLPKRRSSSASSTNQVRTSTLVISGGDGYEDFRMNSASEAAGNGDSTNHMLVWKV
uniref:Rho guanine nucleotide exchange factor 17-like n=1 Tax=Phallusia mammillata TaxID=59560 RepID=A0A6F9D785_9ASCI|nr:rho guanine nucleotide exchange factor 17-like [Phallusia mammillata]